MSERKKIHPVADCKQFSNCLQPAFKFRDKGLLQENNGKSLCKKVLTD